MCEAGVVFGGDKRDKGEGEPRDDAGFLPDLVRRAVERSLQALLHSDEGRKNLISALLPRELLQTVLQQVDSTKRDALTLIGREMQQFLQTLNVGDELRKILTSVSFEINTQVRFVPNEDGTLRSEVKASARPRAQAAAKAKKRPPRKRKAKAAPESPDAVERVRAAASGTRRRVRAMVDRIGERAVEIAGGGEEHGEE